MCGTDPGDARPGPEAARIQQQIKRCHLQCAGSRFQALANAGRDRSGKGQRDMQIGGAVRTSSSGHRAKNSRCVHSGMAKGLQQERECVVNRLPAHGFTIAFKVLRI